MSTTRRRFEQFFANPSSIRYAVAAITSLTVLVVVAGAIAMRVFDRSEYPTFGRAVWFTLQTVTTVGYGDLTPGNPVGRIVASIVMLTSIGLVTVLTASVTSTFVAAAARRDGLPPDVAPSEGRIGLDEVARRLDRIERALGLEPDSSTSATDDP